MLTLRLGSAKQNVILISRSNDNTIKVNNLPYLVYVELSSSRGWAIIAKFAAVAERSNVGKWAWYADLDADAVASKLDRNNAYPFDLDATHDERGVRFTVVMYRDAP